MNELTEKAREFVLHGSLPDQGALLKECVQRGGIDGLHATKILFEDMYGGMTYNAELKSPAAYCLIRWGEQGLQALLDGAYPDAPIKTQSLAVEILSTLASGERLPEIRSWVRDDTLVDDILQSVEDWPAIFSCAKRCLRDLFSSFEDEADLALLLGHVFNQAALTNIARVKEVFVALTGRWLAIDSRTLAEFESLIAEKANDEPAFHLFLEKNPQLIDPLAFEVWSKPDIHGAKIPDFLIKRTDNTFLVVEIETPAKSIITSTYQLSAEANHAVSQAADYVEFLTTRNESIRTRLPDFTPPDSLVVVGLEHPLNAEQMRALQRENRTRHGIRIVGFDYLLDRARSTLNNFIVHGVTVTKGFRIF